MIVVDESEPVGEIEPPFESRDVHIRRGINVRDFYEMEEEIGRGKFGTVFKCREKSTGLRLAAKFVQAPKKADRINVEREVEIMKSLRNPRLIQLYDAYDDGKKEICLLLELIEGGELFERVIDDDFVLTERACAIFMRQICEGIQFIHLQHVLHLDMKPENILCLTRQGNRIKLIDFGLARRYDPSKKLQVLFGTPEFVAPEVVNFDQIGYGTDLWSVGIICYVLLSGLSPFMGESDVETMANVTIAKYDFDDEAFNDVSAEAKDFISKLLVKQISKRLTATECLRHPWLRPRPPLPAPAPPPESESEESDEEEDSLESSPSTPTPTPSPPHSPPPVVSTTINAELDQPPTEIIAPEPERSRILSADEKPFVPPASSDDSPPTPDLTTGQKPELPVQPTSKPSLNVVDSELPAIKPPSPKPSKKIEEADEQPVNKPVKQPSPKPPKNAEKSELPFNKSALQPIPRPSKKVEEQPPIKKSFQLPSPKPLKKVPQSELPMNKFVQPQPPPRSHKRSESSEPPASSKSIQQTSPRPKKKTEQSDQTSDKSVQETSSKKGDQSEPSLGANKSAQQPTAEQSEILQLTKVNLRQFVERWSSHPNSPFQLCSADNPVSLLISGAGEDLPQVASRTSLTGMSPSPPTSLPTSPIVKNHPVVVESVETSLFSQYSAAAVESTDEQNNLRATLKQTQQQPQQSTSVETVIEQTSALLKSVKESLIRQMESGTAVRDRTGARVWERKGSGMIGSPGAAHLQYHRRSPFSTAGSVDGGGPVVVVTDNKVVDATPATQTAATSLEPAGAGEAISQDIKVGEDWEEFTPVAARTFGFAKRHKPMNSTMTVVATSTEQVSTTSSTQNSSSIAYSSSSLIQMESHQP